MSKGKEGKEEGASEQASKQVGFFFSALLLTVPPLVLPAFP